MAEGYPSTYWKLQASMRGVRLSDDVSPRVDEMLSPHTRADGKRVIDLNLPGEVTLTAAIEEGETEPLVAPLQLSSGRGGLVLHMDVPGGVRARAVQPQFYQRHTSTGQPMWRVAASLGGLLVVNPSAVCSFALRGAPCRFCRAGSAVPVAEAFPMSVSEVVETVRAAFDEDRGGPVYFNTGYLGGEDSGIAFLEPYIRAVKRNFATVVAVQLHPPKTNRWIDRTYAMGVDAMACGIEIYDPTVLQRLCPGRTRFIGRDRYYEALAYAATIFPKGTVWSDLVLGIEPPESTREGINTLVRDGVLPVLSTMPVAALAQLRGVTPPPVEEMLALLTHLYGAVRAAHLPIGWVRSLSYAVTPFESCGFAGEGVSMPGPADAFFGTRLGNLLARNLARVRRRLRVRETDDDAHVAEG